MHECCTVVFCFNWCVDAGLQLHVGSNEDGYIPLNFEHESTLHIVSDAAS
jgi:hypothetical protein